MGSHHFLHMKLRNFCRVSRQLYTYIFYCETHEELSVKVLSDLKDFIRGHFWANFDYWSISAWKVNMIYYDILYDIIIHVW